MNRAQTKWRSAEFLYGGHRGEIDFWDPKPSKEAILR